jgi:DNA-binding transcriptional LysR family regulator
MSDLHPRPGLLDLDFSTFLAVVRYGTLSEAAGQLHVTQSTVSYRLRVLESHLGLILLDRGRGRQEVRLTADGEELLKLAERWEMLHLEIQQLSMRGPVLSVGAPESVNRYVLDDAYSALADADDFQIRIVTANSRELYELLDRHELDIAFPWYSRPSVAHHVEEFLRQQMVVVTGSTFPTAAGRVDLALLPAENEIQICWPDPISGVREANGPARVSVDAIDLVLPFLRNPTKWTVVPAAMGDRLAQLGNWRVYPIAQPVAEQAIFKVVRRGLPRATRRSAELFEQQLWRSCRLRVAPATSA